MIVGAHDQKAVLDRYRDDQRPKDEGQRAKSRFRRELISHDVHNSLQGIERAGP